MKGEAYEQAKRDVDDAWYEKFGRDKASSCEQKPAFANAPDSDAKENMAADSFANEGVERSNEGVTCGTCAECHDPLWRICTDYDDGMANTTCISSVKATTEACGNYRPRTDTLEQVFKDLESDINLALELALSHIPDDDPDSEWAEIAGILTYAGTSKDGSAEQRLRDCGVDIGREGL